MKAFLFSDLHVSFKGLDNLNKFLENEKEIELLIFAGDVLNQGEPVGFADHFIEVVKGTGRKFVWVPGNNDFGRGYHHLNKAFPSLEGKITVVGDHTFTGVGGSPASWAGQYAGESLIESKKIAGTIFVSHVPPPGIHNYQREDCKSPTGFSADAPRSLGEVGSSTGEILNRVQDDRPKGRRLSDSPLVHICGHVHQQWGCTFLGQTKIIKLAPLERGFYAIMDLDTLEVEFKRF